MGDVIGEKKKKKEREREGKKTTRSSPRPPQANQIGIMTHTAFQNIFLMPASRSLVGRRLLGGVWEQVSQSCVREAGR